MSGRAIIQVTSIAGTWREVSRCSADDTVVQLRLREASARYKKQVRAVDEKTGTLLGLL